MSRRQGCAWPVGDPLGAELWLSRQSQGLIHGGRVFGCHSAEPPALPGEDTQNKTLPPGKLHLCHAPKKALCRPVPYWLWIFFFSPNAFALFWKSD